MDKFKCELLYLGYGNKEYTYRLEGQVLDLVAAEKDLGILISKDSKVGYRCTEAYKKANWMLGIIKSTTVNKETKVLLALFTLFLYVKHFCYKELHGICWTAELLVSWLSKILNLRCSFIM